MNTKGILYWITGLSGAGKTTIGTRLYYELKKQKDNVVLLDGDILKNIVDDSLGYTEEDRRKRAMKYAGICKMLTDQGIIVICCTIAMYDEVRDWNRKNNNGYVEIFLDVPVSVLMERDQKGMYSRQKKGELKNLAGIDMQVEFPKNPDIVIHNDGRYTVRQCVEKILHTWGGVFFSGFDRDTAYWNQYYKNKPDINFPSLFAEEVGKYIKAPGELLDLGCGNGRDSIYFGSLGLHVTGVDASDVAIAELCAKYQNEENICFLCADFVCAPIIYARQYDYCYSRFSIHAINDEQENDLIASVHQSLKDNGKFFIEVRSVNDELCGKGEMVGRNSYIYEGHFRRFVVKQELEQKLVNAGFCLEYSEESRGFAPYGETDPPVIRIIAKRKY